MMLTVSLPTCLKRSNTCNQGRHRHTHKRMQARLCLRCTTDLVQSTMLCHFQVNLNGNALNIRHPGIKEKPTRTKKNHKMGGKLYFATKKMEPGGKSQGNLRLLLPELTGSEGIIGQTWNSRDCVVHVWSKLHSRLSGTDDLITLITIR